MVIIQFKRGLIMKGEVSRVSVPVFHFLAALTKKQLQVVFFYLLHFLNCACMQIILNPLCISLFFSERYI